jgi:peroxiredoxin Q/BCP
MAEAGDIAPDFEVPDQDGNMVRLSGYLGKTVILYFYPRASTPGCTIEACSFRDASPDFDAVNAVILGVSPDTPKAQLKFAGRFKLPFRLLADADHAIAEKYGVWTEKSLYGRKYMGVDRTTFVIGPDGTIARVFRKVKIAGHSKEVLQAVRQAS